MNTPRKYLLCLLVTITSLWSCGDIKEVTYFNDLQDQTMTYDVQNFEPIVQKNDLLSITVTSPNGEANQLFNLYTPSNSSSSNANAGTITQTAGFLVDQDGNIELPIIGELKAEGKTKKALKTEIEKTLVDKNVLYDPVVNIRYLNYKITVLGQVQHPSVYNVPNEKITLLEALGLAGDITVYGKKDNVLVIREDGEGKRISKHINLNTTELLHSPYYFLKPNDVVYVAPNKANVASANTTKLWLPALFGFLSFLTVILDKVIQ